MTRMCAFLVILGKNYRIFCRTWLQTFIVILIPLLLSFTLLFVRNRSTRTEVSSTTKWDLFAPNSIPTPPKEIDKWILTYCPNNSVVNVLMQTVARNLSVAIHGFPSEPVLLNYLSKNGSRPVGLLGAVVFDSNFSLFNASYTIRLHNSLGWYTRSLYPKFAEGKPRTMNRYGSPPDYFSSGFLAVQSAIDYSITRLLCTKSGSSVVHDTVLKRMPYPPYLDDGFIPVLQKQLSFVIVIGFMFPILYSVRTILVEKREKRKEMLKMLGVSNGAYWSSWLVAHLSIFVIICAALTGILCSNLSPNGPILSLSNPLLVFWLLFLYAYSLTTFGFAISTLFDSPHTGTAVSCAILIVTFLPYSLLDEHYNELNLATKITSAFLPSVGLGFVCMIIGQFEGIGLGAQFSSLFIPANPGDDLSLSSLWIILMIQGKLFMLLTLYIDAVWPGRYGVPKPWYFPLTCCLCRHKSTPSSLVEDVDTVISGASLDASDNDGASNSNALDCQAIPAVPDFDALSPRITESATASCLHHTDISGKYIEMEPIGLPVGIALQCVRKIYKTKQTVKVAVSGLTMNVFQGQITVLLGHNGAGKTTTLSILTGLFPPTSGTAFVGGHDIHKDIAGVRKCLGFCPQHDIYFPDFTVEEHLTLVARLKGVCRAELEAHVNSILRQTYLVHKRRAYVGTLSGGTRRRLSIGMALIGDSKVVILDEPTSGLDPEARRQVWSILQAARASRAVLVTTHYMDEADHLGDRIAILADGKLQCLGSPLFLKSKYGAGYLLTITKPPEHHSVHLISCIRQHVKSAEIRNDEGSELRVLLPLDSVCQFAALFKELEHRKTDLGILGFGVSVTTMEEVFVRVSEQRFHQNDPQMSRQSSDRTEVSGTSEKIRCLLSDVDESSSTRSVSTFAELQEMRYHGLSLCWNQLLALLTKRAIYVSRHRVLTFSQLLVPFALSLLALLLFRHITERVQADDVRIPLSLVPYGRELVVSYANEMNTKESTLSEQFLQAYASQFDRTVVSTSRLDQPNTYEDDLIDLVGQPKVFVYRNKYVVGLVIQSSSSESFLSLRPYFQGESFHAAPIALNAVTNGFLRLLANRSRSHPSECPGLSSASGPIPTVATYNQPLPRSEEERMLGLNTTEGLVTTLIAGVPLVSNLLIAMSFLAAGFAVPLIHEYTSKAKHLQSISGVKWIPYWLSNYLCDILLYLLVSGAVLCAFAGFNFDAFETNTRLYLLGLLFATYAWAVVPEMYLLARFFKSPTSGLVWLTVLNYISAVTGLLTAALLCYPSVHQQKAAFLLRYFWVVWSPTFGFADGVFTVFANYQFRRLCDRPEVEMFCLLTQSSMPCCLKTCDPFCAYWTANNLSFEYGGIAMNLCAMMTHGFVFGALVFFVDTAAARRLRLFITSGCARLWYWSFHRDQCFRPLKSAVSTHSDDGTYLTEDEDVRQHRHLVESMPLGRLRTQTCLALRNVSKSFGSDPSARSRPAVDRVTLAIFPRECFGLLGVNGAGKTTTFRMITGDLDQSDGEILVNGLELHKDMYQAHQSMGYCPQFDALLPYLTGRETLLLYARLRGMYQDIANVEVDRLLHDLDLSQYANVRVCHYSGGKLRKLSVAVALIGDTPLICLDEPTSGVDPVSRRRMWNVLLRCRRQGRTLLLSSHSMEECETLCSRVSIFVNGRLKCLGTCQHLKRRFGRGYSLILQVSTPSFNVSSVASEQSVFPATTDSASTTVVTERNRMQQIALDEAVARVDQFVRYHMPLACLVDRHQGVVHYHLPITLVDSFSLGNIFNLLETNKVNLALVNYSVSQTTLEQVFIDLAKRQDEPVFEDSHVRLWRTCARQWCSCCLCKRKHHHPLYERLHSMAEDSEQESLFA